MSVFGFRSAPTYRPANVMEQMQAAFEQPMSFAGTLLDQTKGNVLDSMGLGTAIRDMSLPEEAPREPTLTMKGPDGETITLPDTPQMRRRATVQGIDLMRETPEQLDQRRAEVKALDEDAYKSSPYFREGVAWDRGMTEDRAAALAEAYDVKRVRQHFAEKRPITAFIGALAGQALDPINYIPVVGPAVKAANVARFGRVAGTAVTGSIDAALNTAGASALTFSTRKAMGDDITWQSTITDIAMSAIIGGAFGTVGGLVDARRAGKLKQAEDEARSALMTLKNVQESRIALNSAIDGLARGDDVNLSANAIATAQRMAMETEQISRAFDQVSASPTGAARDPLVRVTPDEIEGTIVARGAFKDINELEFSKRGWGLVKVIWGHGDKSGEPPEFRIAKEDIVDLPAVIRDFEPSSVSDDGLRREWRVERNGRTVAYADTMMGDEGRHLVTAYVVRPGKDAPPPLSKKREPALPESAPQAGNLVEDTAGGRSIGNPEVRQMPAESNIARYRAIDNRPASAEPIPAGKAEAEARVATPDTYKAMGEQYRVNPDDGTFVELADIEQVRKEGRITPEDDMALNDAETTYQNGVAYGEALKAAVACII